MEINKQNSLFQIKNLLTQLSNHIYKVNEIIVNLNNIMNHINNPMINNFNNQMNKMNNCMGFINSNRPIYNMKIDSFPKNNNIEVLNNDDELLNIGFKLNHSGGPLDKNIVISKNKTINELLNLYLEKIHKDEYIDKYDNNFTFLYNGEDIKKYKDKKIEEIGLADKSYILAITNK